MQTLPFELCLALFSIEELDSNRGLLALSCHTRMSSALFDLMVLEVCYCWDSILKLRSLLHIFHFIKLLSGLSHLLHFILPRMDQRQFAAALLSRMRGVLLVDELMESFCNFGWLTLGGTVQAWGGRRLKLPLHRPLRNSGKPFAEEGARVVGFRLGSGWELALSYLVDWAPIFRDSNFHSSFHWLEVWMFMIYLLY